MERLKEILITMDIPINRINDLSWLLRNIGIRNNKHPDLKECIELIKSELRR